MNYNSIILHLDCPVTAIHTTAMILVLVLPVPVPIPLIVVPAAIAARVQLLEETISEKSVIRKARIEDCFKTCASHMTHIL